MYPALDVILLLLLLLKMLIPLRRKLCPLAIVTSYTLVAHVDIFQLVCNSLNTSCDSTTPGCRMWLNITCKQARGIYVVYDVDVSLVIVPAGLLYHRFRSDLLLLVKVYRQVLLKFWTRSCKDLLLML